jgi:ribonucleoside-diphosphate reductase alpha chain
VCVLSSLNLARYDEYRDWRSSRSNRSVPEIAVHLLDAVVSEFIRKGENKVGLGRAVRFAEKSRALGLGTMGLHTLYQKRGLPFKSNDARTLNIESHRWIREEAEKASRVLAVRFGEPDWCGGSGLRHTHLTAVAPTRTNSVISGAFSQGIEPIDSNYFVAKQAKGTFVRKNPVLEQLFCDRGIPESVWDEILQAKGSVQELDCLTDAEKEVFLTAREIDQFELVKQAADRQQFICQGQSLNLFVDPESDAAYIFRLHLTAWKNGLKSLYYLKSSSLLAKKNVVPALLVTKPDCPWCEKLKKVLQAEGVTYEEITKKEAEDKGYWNPEWKTVPQMWLYKKHIGGYTEYVNLNQTPPSPNGEAIYETCEACEA